jgi:hypothetical protein
MGTKESGELIRFGLGARNWLFAQLDGPDELYIWKPPGGGRSAEEILEHIAWVISAVCIQIAEDLGLTLVEPEITEERGLVARLKSEIGASYEMFTQLCQQIEGETLERVVHLPPPARLREGSIERVMRIMMGYHVVHHAGQIAMVLSMAKKV